MTKQSIAGTTVKLPEAFNEAELQRRIGAHFHHYEKLNSTILVRSEHVFTFLQEFQERVLEGRRLVHDAQHRVFSNPFICSMTKLEDEIEQDHKDIREAVESEYRKEIANALEAQKEILIAQRLAELEAKEEEAQRKKREKLLNELEKEADAVLDPSLFGL